MAARIPALLRSRTVIGTHINSQVKLITTFSFLSQEPLLAAEDEPILDPGSKTIPLPPNPATGSPIYNENWRSPLPYQGQTGPPSNHLVTVPGFPLGYHMPSKFQNKDPSSLETEFSLYVTSTDWAEIKKLFELWIRSLDKNGRPNKPTVQLYNQYLRANLMLGATVSDLLDLIAQMEDFAICPNTASCNLVLKAMYSAGEYQAAEKLLQRMEMTDESKPDDETYNLVIQLLFLKKRTDAAFKYVENALKRGCKIYDAVFQELVNTCVKERTLNKLVLVIEMCKKMELDKAICPSCFTCELIAREAIRNDHSKLTLYALEFIAMWIARTDETKLDSLSQVEPLAIQALKLARKAYDSALLGASWAVLRRLLRNRNPSREAFVSKINAHASLGNLEKAFSALREFETAYKSDRKDDDMFSPFTSLYPLVVACASNGWETLDMVYYQLESLSSGERPYKSVVALNCVILGCSNIWDLVRSYQTFEAIGSSFGLSPDVPSFLCLLHASGWQKGISEVDRVFSHMVSLGIKPNFQSYSLLIDAHLAGRDTKSALSVVESMVAANFHPNRAMLKKIRRRCVREMDYDSNDAVEDFAKRYKIQMGTENHRNLLFSIDYSTTFNDGEVRNRL